MKKNGTILFSILIVAAIVLSACQPAAVQPTTAAPPPTSPPAQTGFDWKRFSGKEVTLLLNEHPWTEGLRTVIDEFTATTGIKVNMQPFAEDLYFDKMELALRSDKPVADVYFLPMDSTAFTQYSANLIAPLTPFINDPTMTSPDYNLADFPEGFRAGAMYPPGDANAQLYGIPITFETYILFYNKDLVNQYLGGKVPQTMEELIADAQKITDEGKGEVYGSVMRGIRSDTIMDTLSGVVFNSWGTDPTPLPYGLWFNGDWKKPRFTDPRIQDGLANYAALMKSGPPNVQSIDWNDANQLFAQGKVAFFIDASLFGPAYEDPASSQVAGKVGYMPIPKTAKGAMTGHWLWGLGIPANSQNKEAAWYFIQWATSKAIEPKIGTKTGGAPRLSSWDNATYSSSLNADYVTAVKTAMATSRPTAVFYEGWKEIAIMIVDAVQEIYGGTDPAKAMQTLQDKALPVVNK
ncbi:MAG: sugar ABC transporter substrate-binding protein [Chloroflexi bacterium]|nr:sugar ABC transporter substrate-binding protein [Chloroflexota bacterium]